MHKLPENREKDLYISLFRVSNIFILVKKETKRVASAKLLEMKPIKRISDDKIEEK